MGYLISTRGRYEAGNPHINLCLAVLAMAKKDDAGMWHDFKEEHNMNNPNCDPFGIALWVADWWNRIY